MIAPGGGFSPAGNSGGHGVGSFVPNRIRMPVAGLNRYPFDAEAAAASNGYLFKPATGIRIRFGTNDPTPWPPELPAGENPPPGAIIDYYLPAAANGEVKLEFLNTQGELIRTYPSNDPVRSPDPATDPVAYNKLCQQTAGQVPATPDCGLPLY